MKKKFGRAHKILLLIAYMRKRPLNALAGVFSGARGVKFGLNNHLHPYFVGAAKALAILSLSTGSLESLSLHDVISTKISYAGSFILLYSETCLKRSLKNRQNKSLKDR